jgi:hypothetical protein
MQCSLAGHRPAPSQVWRGWPARLIPVSAWVFLSLQWMPPNLIISIRSTLKGVCNTQCHNSTNISFWIWCHDHPFHAAAAGCLNDTTFMASWLRINDIHTHVYKDGCDVKSRKICLYYYCVLHTPFNVLLILSSYHDITCTRIIIILAIPVSMMRF